MTQTPRWRSSNLNPAALEKGGFWGALLGAGVSLLGFSPIFTPAASVSIPLLSWMAHLFFLFILWGWLFQGPARGVPALVWGGLTAGLAGLACREPFLIALPVFFALFAAVSAWGAKRWQEAVQAARLQAGRAEERLNALEDSGIRSAEMLRACRERLARYKRLRQIANSFCASLCLEELTQRITQATAELIDPADLVLLYLVSPGTLTLELKSVFRRAGSTAVRAKTGDLFDQWVMRQAQPLLLEEPSQDFRFAEAGTQALGRPLGSLLSVPLASEHRFLGVLRAESVRPRALGPDELRLLRIVGDLASLAIENSRLYDRMAELAITDDLTGLAVRSYFEKRLAEEMNRSRGLGIPLSILLIDIDHFKRYNDSFGHAAGDKMLRHLAALLRQMRWPGEVVGRFGGEELVSLLPGANRQEALSRAEVLRKEVERSQVELRRLRMEVTVSIGTATFPGEGQTPEELLKTADERLYLAKERGRNQVCSG
ncbi:MAG: diguanylate cyclase [Candidatus Omnitrophica bacterium]|nr:diguanylate cyclase [Candidatus Omnitrophota bacterium]